MELCNFIKKGFVSGWSDILFRFLMQGALKKKKLGVYGLVKNIALILSGSLIRGGQKLEYPEKNHMTYVAEHGISHVSRARLQPQW